MPVFSLEALPARSGDAMLLHFGPADAPRRLLVDGGPATAWDSMLRSRLNALRGDSGHLDLPLVVVSDTSDEHLGGILELLQTLREADLEATDPPVSLRALWLNTTEALLGDEEAGAVLESLKESSEQAETAGRRSAEAAQGRLCRCLAEALSIPLNADPGEGLLEESAALDLGDGLSLQVLWPRRWHLERLRRDWQAARATFKPDQPLSADAAREIEAVLGGPLRDLASLVVLLQVEERRVLLTGNARGADVVRAASQAGLMDDDSGFVVDVLKVPHHGCDRYLDTEFFRRVRARHYIVSADGRHGHPDIAALQMLIEARRTDGEPYTLHFTHRFSDFHPGYPVSELRCILDCYRRHGHPVEIREPHAADAATVLHLLDLPENDARRPNDRRRGA